MYAINAACDCCKKKWSVQMTEQGEIFHLCIKHAEELLQARDADGKNKNQPGVNKWLKEARLRKAQPKPPIVETSEPLVA